VAVQVKSALEDQHANRHSDKRTESLSKISAVYKPESRTTQRESCKQQRQNRRHAEANARKADERTDAERQRQRLCCGGMQGGDSTDT
jgi:hypothetical protein